MYVIMFVPRPFTVHNAFPCFYGRNKVIIIIIIMEHHVNGGDSRGVRQCAETFPKYEMDVTQLYYSS